MHKKYKKYNEYRKCLMYSGHFLGIFEKLLIRINTPFDSIVVYEIIIVYNIRIRWITISLEVNFGHI